MARIVFLAAFFLALPGVLWQAFEMYGLTLGGSQMLFFSIVHTMPWVALLVVAAFPLGLIALLWALLALALPTLGDRLALSGAALISIAGYLMVHAALLAAYETWSSAFMRVPICILGIALLGGSAIVFASSFAGRGRGGRAA
jgi:hypothetical protein